MLNNCISIYHDLSLGKKNPKNISQNKSVIIGGEMVFVLEGYGGVWRGNVYTYVEFTSECVLFGIITNLYICLFCPPSQEKQKCITIY